jgi:hypothetical protein
VALFLLSYIRVEPPAGFAPAPSSLPRKRPDSGTARACAGRPGFEPGIVPGSRPGGSAEFPYRPTGSLRPGSNGLPAVYKTAALPGELRRHRVLGAIRTRTAQPLMLVPPADWATRTSEPPSGADPDRPPYEGGAAAVRGGEGFRGWTRTSEDKGQGLAGDNRRPTRNRYGRRDSNSHTAGFEPTRYPSSRHARMVRRQGLEPRFPGLRVQCCTRIARGAWSGMQESNPHSRFGGPAH